jgi:hypothetical protein
MFVVVHQHYVAPLLAFFLCSSTQAADWLSLQGTEPASATNGRIWGFVQGQYQHNASTPNAAGGYISPKLVGPNLTSQTAFNINRARLGIRGFLPGSDKKINYAILTEAGNNGITEPTDAVLKVVDASVTFTHIPGAKVRVGLFKTPTAEEGLRGMAVSNYINFTWATNQLLLERFANPNYTPNVAPQTLPPSTDLNGYERGVAAFRDVGLQVFDTRKLENDWELTYAAMLGNGNGLTFKDNNSEKDLYLYLAGEKVYGGKGGRRQGLKLFGWSQKGVRTADFSNDDTYNPIDYDRHRYGLGFKYLKQGLRISGEYFKGKGMIWVAPHNPSFGMGPAAGNPLATDGHGAFGRSNGYYIEAGYRLQDSAWELDARFDVYNRLDGDRFEVNFDNVTLGAQYFFSKKTRLAINYEIRSANAPNFAAGAGPNNNLDGVGNIFSLQVSSFFSQ